MPSDMDRRVRCGRPEWTAAVGPDGLSTSRGLDALQYASLAGSSTGPTAACRGYRNDHLLEDQGYLQREERVPEHLISEGCTSENMVPAYNMVKSVRRTNSTSGMRAKPVSFIRGGSDGNGLPRMALQQDQFFIRRRPQQAVGAPRVVDASDLVDTGGRHCIINKSMQRERDGLPVQLSKGSNHLLAMERNTSGDRDRVTQGRHPISSAATFQLYGQPAAPLSTGGDGSGSFGQTHHQQQYSIRHRYEQCQSAVQDRVKDGYYGDVIASAGGRAPGDEGRALSRAAENIINRSVVSDTGVDAGHRHTTGSSHTYRPIPVHIDTTAPTSNINTRPYDSQSSVGRGNTNNTSSLQLRGTYDGRYQRVRGVLSADPSEMGANRVFAPGHSGDASRFHHYKEDCGIGGRSSVNMGGEGGGEYQATAPFTHMRRSLSETANSSLASSYGGIRNNVTRRSAPQHRQRLQVNQRPSFRLNDDTNDVTAFNDGASAINVNESSSRFAASATTTTTASLSPPGHRPRKGFVAPSDLAIKGERISSPEFAALSLSTNRNSTASVLGSPHAHHMGLEMIDNHSSCRLQNFRMLQSISGDGFPTTPRSSGSTSTSSLTSPSRSASLLSTGDGGLLDQRADLEKMCRAGCPAPDCPGKGDCVPGATADTVAYEVTFKRGKMTFLLGDGLGDEGISCGDRVKVEADRGEDLGTVHRSLLLSEYLDALYEEKKAKAAKIAQNGGGGGGDGGGSEGKKKRNKAKKHSLAEDGDKHSTSKQHHHQQQKKQQQHEEVRDETCPVRTIKRILRPATEEELQQLEQKAQEEEQILHVCQTKVRNRGLPMKIVDAEYQFDRHKLTLFFEAERRVDFRELVRDLFAVYKTRIWMQQVKDKDKKSTSSLSGNTAPDNDAPASAIGSCGNSSSNAPGLGNPFLNVPSSLLIDDAVTAHDADHDSGYGSAISSDSGHPMVECLVSLAEGGDGSDTGGGGGSGSGALGFDSINEAFCNHNDSFKKSGSTPCAPSMSWLDEIESNESVGGSSGGISYRSKRPFAAQYPVLLQGIDFSF